MIESGEIIGNVISRGGGSRDSRGLSLINVDGVEVAYNLVAHHPPGDRITNGITISSSSTNGPARHVDAHHNIVYYWGQAIRFNNTSYEACECRDSDFQGEDPDAHIWYDRNGGAPGKVMTSNLRFYSPRSESQRYRANGNRTFAEWQKAMGDTTSTEVRVKYPHPDRLISDYLGCGSLAAFLAEAREQSRATWRPEYSAPAVVAWFRKNFGITLPASRDEK